MQGTPAVERVSSVPTNRSRSHRPLTPEVIEEASPNLGSHASPKLLRIPRCEVLEHQWKVQDRILKGLSLHHKEVDFVFALKRDEPSGAFPNKRIQIGHTLSVSFSALGGGRLE